MKAKNYTLTGMLIAALQLTPCAVLAQGVNPPDATTATISLSFQDADVGPVTAAVSRAIKQTIIVDPRVKGRLTLNTPKPVTPQVALDMYSSSLRSAGFALVQVNGMYRVVPDSDARVQGNRVLTQGSAEGD